MLGRISPYSTTIIWVLIGSNGELEFSVFLIPVNT